MDPDEYLEGLFSKPDDKNPYSRLSHEWCEWRDGRRAAKRPVTPPALGRFGLGLIFLLVIMSAIYN